jgi:hypothetical protein
VKLKSTTASGIHLDTTGESVKGDLQGAVKVTHKTSQVGTVEFEAGTSGAVKYSVKNDKLAKGVVVKASGDEKPSGKLEVDYSKPNLGLSATVDASDKAFNVGAAAVAGFEGLSVGGEAVYDTKASKVADYNAGAEFEQADLKLTVRTLERADKLEASYHHKLRADLTTGASFSYNIVSDAKLLTVGGSYAVSDASTLKAKADTAGTVSTFFEHKVRASSVKFGVLSVFDAKKASATPEKYGLTLTFGDIDRDK